MAGADGGEVEAEGGAGEVGEGAGQVVEAFGLGCDGGDGDEGLEAVGEGDGGDEGGEEGVGEVGCAEEGGDECHEWELGCWVGLLGCEVGMGMQSGELEVLH